MLTTTRRWLWVLAGSLAVACGLNPQPDLPGSNGSSSGNNAGGSGVVTPSAGTGNINVGGAAATAGSGSGGTFSLGGSGGLGGLPTNAAGANAGGEASGGEASGGGGGDGGEGGENALEAGSHG